MRPWGLASVAAILAMTRLVETRPTRQPDFRCDTFDDLVGGLERFAEKSSVPVRSTIPSSMEMA
jgi:hypothetical protein